MYIKRKLSQHRRDFLAEFECEHCGHTTQRGGYDDSYFHDKVIPAMKCQTCGKTAGRGYEPIATRYSDSEVI